MLLDYAEWDMRGGEPFSRRFDDIYYHPGNGCAESEHTFLHGNDLFARFAALGSAHFTIAETGFGTGLNCFLTAGHFLRLAPHGRLTYVSAEKYPIHPDALPHVQRHFPAAALRERFYRQNPDNHAGFHLIHLHPRVDLLLLLGDAASLYAQLDAQVDAWFLDGFAPGRNPDMWQDALWQHMARLSRPGSTAASFSAARVVRDGLAKAGFAVERTPGFGRKRHMVRARCIHARPAPPAWYDRPPRHDPASPVAVIGAGIAGSSTAHALAARGFAVDIYDDAHARPPASAVPVAIPYLQPDTCDTAARRYQLTARHYALRFLHDIAAKHPHVFTAMPIRHLPADNTAALRHPPDLLNARHRRITNGGWHEYGSGVIRLPDLCAALTASPQISRRSPPPDTLVRNSDGWHIGNRSYASVILCTGWHTALIPEAYARDALRPLRGQATLMTGGIPDSVYCRGKALIPLADGCYAGATYQPNSADTAVHSADTAANLAFAQQFVADVRPAGDFVGIRAACRDYWPLLGALAQSASLARDYAPWRHHARLPIHAAADYHPGLYLHAGLGSKGCTHAFVNAALLAAHLDGTPAPLPRELLPCLAPARFFIRTLKRRQV